MPQSPTFSPYPRSLPRPPLRCRRRLGSWSSKGFPAFRRCCRAPELTRAPGRRLAPPYGATKANHDSLGDVCNFSDTSCWKSPRSKGSIGHAFTVCIRTENQNQMSFYPFVPHEISVLVELILGHLRYLLTDVPPQPNSPPDNVFHLDRRAQGLP